MTGAFRRTPDPGRDALLRLPSLLVAALVASLAACGEGEGGGSEPGEDDEEAAGRDSVVTVRTSALDLAGLTEVRPRPATRARTVTLVGRLAIDPARRGVVRAPASGRFRLGVTTGDRVARGDSLGWIASPETYPDSLPLTAPTGGEVVDLPAGPSGLVEGWEALATVASTDTLRLVVPVPPDRYGDVRQGAVLTIGSVAAPGPGMRTRVTGFLPTTDVPPTLRAVARVPNPGGELWPGMRVPVALELGERVSGHWLPEASVLYDRERPDRTVAFLRRGDGYVQVPVEVGARTADSVFVTSGVDSLDTVVAEGSYQLLYADFSFRGIGAEAGEMEEGEEDEGGP